jgi:hypothetical protein
MDKRFNKLSVRAGGTLFTNAQDYYKYIAANEPRQADGTFKDRSRILSRLFLLIPDLTFGSSLNLPTGHPPVAVTLYIEPLDSTHVTIDNWLINCDEPFHVHPEFGVSTDYMESGHVIATVDNGKCSLCMAEFKGELGMINTFYNMGG